MRTTDDQEELFDLVNENDEVIGEVRRAIANNNPKMWHRAVVIHVFNKKGELFLQKRSKTKDIEPGVWSISASGHLTKGQSYEDAAVRELKEELGISAPLKYIEKFAIRGENETEINVIYQTTYEGPFVFSPTEVETGAFFNFDRIHEQFAQNLLPMSRWTQTHLHRTWGLFPENNNLKRYIIKTF